METILDPIAFAWSQLNLVEKLLLAAVAVRLAGDAGALLVRKAAQQGKRVALWGAGKVWSGLKTGTSRAWSWLCSRRLRRAAKSETAYFTTLAHWGRPPMGELACAFRALLAGTAWKVRPWNRDVCNDGDMRLYCGEGGELAQVAFVCGQAARYKLRGCDATERLSEYEREMLDAMAGQRLDACLAAGINPLMGWMSPVCGSPEAENAEQPVRIGSDAKPQGRRYESMDELKAAALQGEGAG